MFATLQMITRCIFVAKTYKLLLKAYNVKNVLVRFKINPAKANPEKFQFMIFHKTQCPEYDLLLALNVIKESDDVKFLGLVVDNNLSFEKHIAKLCQTASYKH